MGYIDYTIQKITLVLDQIERLSHSEFPHSDPEQALRLLKKLFEDDLERINKALGGGDEKVKVSSCAQASLHVALYLPILGFCLRATNVRNSFELFIPLLKLCHQLLKPTTKLILSSEWNFSPFTYPLIFPELPDFVLIGLPASEAGNALVVPLAGHELGHSVWRSYGVDTRIKASLQAKVIAELKQHWADFELQYQTKPDITKIETDLFVRSIWSAALELSLRQAEELFCDSLAVRIFGESYFHAVEYLISPHFGNRRATHYPDIKTRTTAMMRAADTFGVPHIPNFSDRFTEAQPNIDPKQKLILMLSDAATIQAIADLIAVVEAIANQCTLPLPNSGSADAIYKCFKSGVPAKNLVNLADVISAGWKAYFDKDLWKSNSTALERFGPLNELIFKTVEVMEFEIRLRAP
ncbi:MAG: hypothetical protein ACRED7_08895 [Stellaceae bacterium]